MGNVKGAGVGAAAVVMVGLLCGGAAAGPVIIDDPFDGSQLSANWARGSNGPSQPVVSNGRLTISALSNEMVYVVIPPLVQDRTYILNYSTSYFCDVYIESEGDGFQLEFGYGPQLLGPRLEVWADASGMGVFYEGKQGPVVSEGLGSWVGGDYSFERTPSFFKIYRNGQPIYAELDPARVPYYDQMDFGMIVSAGSISFDRVVLLPEPGTMILIGSGVVVVARGYRRRVLRRGGGR